MKKFLVLALGLMCVTGAMAAKPKAKQKEQAEPVFTVVKENAITSIKKIYIIFKMLVGFIKIGCIGRLNNTCFHFYASFFSLNIVFIFSIFIRTTC